MTGFGSASDRDVARIVSRKGAMRSRGLNASGGRYDPKPGSAPGRQAASGWRKQPTTTSALSPNHGGPSRGGRVLDGCDLWAGKYAGKPES